MNHETRAFIVNAEGLPGFLVEYSLMKVLRQAETDGTLEKYTKWQIVDLKIVEENFSKLKTM